MFELNNPYWDHCCKNTKPLANLSKFIHGCTTDDMTRSMTTAATLLTLAQLGGPRTIKRPPGYVLINAGGSFNDPVDALIRQIPEMWDIQIEDDSDSYERHRTAIYWEVELHHRECELGLSTPEKVLYHAGTIGQFQRLAFGANRMGTYTRRYDPYLGCITDRSQHAPLRLDDDRDRAAFRADVRSGAERLVDPRGLGESIGMVTKVISVAGSLRYSQWDAEFVAGIVERGLPVVMLPHAADLPLNVESITPLKDLAYCLACESVKPGKQPVFVDEFVFSDSWSLACMARVRRRLALLPPAYESFMRRTIFEVIQWCLSIAHMTAKDGSAVEDRRALFQNLARLSLHGIAIGLESLAWYGYGFDAACPRQKVLRLLTAIRAEGAITRRDVQRRLQRVKSKDRDVVLERLSDEGLLLLDDRLVTAVPFADFLRAIPARAGLTAPEWRVARASKKVAAK
jgi:hypothetical protein